MPKLSGIPLIIATVSYYYKLPNAEDLPEDKIIELFARIEYFRRLEGGNFAINNNE